jgi:tetratricopeptide (TPR) repeat protein
LGLLPAVVGCEDFVQGVDPLINQVEDVRLNDPSQVSFLTKGVLQRLATTASNMGMLSGGLSDELVFDQDLPRATFPTYRDIDAGEITLDNNSVDGLSFDLNEARFFADDLVRRVNEIEGVDPEDKRDALYTGYLVGGLMRQYLASYWALNPDQPGGVIDAGPFIPASDMYQLALEKYQQAVKFVADDYDKRVVNTLIARVYLLTADYANAASFAEQGLQQGDEPFNAQYSVETENSYYFGGGNGRIQWIVDFRFNDYIVQDPDEANRIKLATAEGTSGKTYFYQNMFPDRDSPFPVTSWQENLLMLAEIDVRNGNSGGALARINTLRASYGLSALTTVDLDVIFVERDKTLFLTGARLLDQHRFDRWHLAPGKWKYLPITARERNANSNLGN